MRRSRRHILAAYSFKVVFKDCGKAISELVKNTYFLSVGLFLNKKNKSWASDYVCKSCVDYFRLTKSSRSNSFKFGTPTVWRAPRNHLYDAYLCSMSINGINAKNRARHDI